MKKPRKSTRLKAQRRRKAENRQTAPNSVDFWWRQWTQFKENPVKTGLATAATITAIYAWVLGLSPDIALSGEDVRAFAVPFRITNGAAPLGPVTVSCRIVKAGLPGATISNVAMIDVYYLVWPKASALVPCRILGGNYNLQRADLEVVADFKLLGFVPWPSAVSHFVWTGDAARPRWIRQES